MGNNKITVGRRVRLPDGTLATVAARSIAGDSWHLRVVETVIRDWPAAQLEVVL